MGRALRCEREQILLPKRRNGKHPVGPPCPEAGEEERTSNEQSCPQDEPLGVQRWIDYRAFVARANHFAPGSPDIVFAAKGLARSMSAPTEGDWQAI